MKSISKRALALAGAAALALGTMSGCGSGKNSAAASVDAASASFPLSETVTFTALTHEPSFAGQEINDRLIAQRLEEATNVHIDWTVYVDDQFGEKKQLALAKKELPDMVFDAQMSQYDLLRYAKDGTIIAVDDLIDQYMPNLKKVLDSYYGQYTTMPDDAKLRLDVIQSEFAPAMESDYDYPPIFFDIDTTDRITQIETDLKPYAESQKATWIMNGGAESEWDAYIAKLNEMNLQELLQLKQTGLDNYFASMNG